MHLSLDKQLFFSLFPNAESDKGGDAIKYTVEDSDYRVYYPTGKDGDNLTLILKLDHIRGGATDDHAELDITFNTDASINSISGTWKAGNDGYTIPKVVITTVDATAEFLGAVGALETVGISEAVANSIVAAFDGFCKLFNTLSPMIVKLSDDGGRFYFIAVVCHAVNRLSTSITMKN
jgi:hypothetical protein